MKTSLISSSLVGLVLAVTLMGDSRDAEAGSGFYDYGVHFGLFDFFEDAGPLEEAEGGFTFGFKRGMYFIKDGLALAIDYLGFDVGLVGEDKDDWYVTLPVAGLGVGTGFDRFMVYVGGSLGLFGIDSIGEDVRFSVLNPRAVGGLQVGFWNLMLRAEFQLGRTIRFGDVPNYTYTNISLTIGYGFYSDFL